MKELQESLGLRTLEDISSIILHSHDLQATLDNIVALVAKRMRSDVCSIYLLEKDGETLTPVSYTHLTLPTNREV